ncbi:MAG TPA: hypothetical protein VL240_01595 [Candidatus Binatia bacterium]|nr:hypothetical protein [Candidatus Binatia bacterium]
MDEDSRREPILNSLPLVEAVLCADCEIISNSGGETCEVCGSRSLLSLGRVLGGCIEGERATLLEGDRAAPHAGFTVLVNPHATSVLHRRRRTYRG